MAEIHASPLFSDANLKAYWRLENETDTSGNGFTLTNNGTIAFNAAKYFKGCELGTANTNKHLNVNNDLGITTGAISVSMWVKSNTTPSGGVVTSLFEHGDSGSDTRRWIRYNDAAGTPQLQFNRQKENIANDAFSYNITLSTSEFTHIVYTYDGTTIRGYVNGVDIGNVAASGNGASGVDIDYTYIGARRSQTPAVTSYANILTDDVAVFNRALTATEVLSIFNEQVTTNYLKGRSRNRFIFSGVSLG